MHRRNDFDLLHGNVETKMQSVQRILDRIQKLAFADLCRVNHLLNARHILDQSLELRNFPIPGAIHQLPRAHRSSRPKHRHTRGRLFHKESPRHPGHGFSSEWPLTHRTLHLRIREQARSGIFWRRKKKSPREPVGLKELAQHLSSTARSLRNRRTLTIGILTTIGQPTSNIGRIAAQCVLNQLKGLEPFRKQITVEPELVVRESTRGINGGSKHGRIAARSKERKQSKSRVQSSLESRQVQHKKSETKIEGAFPWQPSPPKTEHKSITRIGAKGSPSCLATAGRCRLMIGTPTCCSFSSMVIAS